MSDGKNIDKKSSGDMRSFLTTNNEVVTREAQSDEPRLISIMLKDKAKLQDAIASNIKSHHFRDKVNGFFYLLMVKHYEKHNSLLTKHAMETIMGQQKNIREEDKSNRQADWERLYLKENSDEDYSLLKANINNRYLQDQMFTILEEEAAEIVGATAKQDEMVRRIQDRVNKIEGIDPDAFSLIMPFDKGTQLAYDYISERRDHPERSTGVMTGIKALDEEFYGLERGSYTVISGMTNGGKTTLMFNLGFNMAKNDLNVVYISLEKKALPLNVRLLCLHAMVDYNRVKRGGSGERGIDVPTQIALDKAKADLDNIAPSLEIVQMSQDDTLTQVISKIEEIKSNKKIDVLILDYLGCLGLESKTVGRPDLDQANVSRRFQAYCKRNNYVGITGIQIKASATKEIRKTVKKQGQTTNIQDIAIHSEDLAGSQEIIRDADNSIGVVLNADQPPTILYAHSTKARDNQGHRTIELSFDGFIGKISDPSVIVDSIEEIDQNIYGNDITNLFDEDVEDGEDDEGVDEVESVTKLPDEKVVEESSVKPQDVVSSKSEDVVNLDDYLS